MLWQDSLSTAAGGPWHSPKEVASSMPSEGSLWPDGIQKVGKSRVLPSSFSIGADTLPIPISAKKQSALGHLQGQRAHYLLGKTVLLLASGFSLLSKLGGRVGRVSHWAKDPVLALSHTLCPFCRREQLDTMCFHASFYHSVWVCRSWSCQRCWRNPSALAHAKVASGAPAS